MRQTTDKQRDDRCRTNFEMLHTTLIEQVCVLRAVLMCLWRKRVAFRFSSPFVACLLFVVTINLLDRNAVALLTFYGVRRCA